VIAILTSLVLGGGAIFGVVIGWRWLDWQRWQQSLSAMTVRFPHGLTSNQVSAWCAMLASLRTPIGLEMVAAEGTISHYVLAPKSRIAEVRAGTQAMLPGVHLDEAADYVRDGRAALAHMATEFKLTHLSHQLAAERAETTAGALLLALAQLQAGERVWVRWVILGTSTPKPRTPQDPARQLALAEKAKHAYPLMQAVGRIGVEASRPGRAGALLARISGSLRVLDAPGVAVVRRSLPGTLAGSRLARRALPLTVWPLTINSLEAAGLIGVPVGTDVSVPGLSLQRSRQLGPGNVPSRGGTTLALSNYSGHVGQPLVIAPADRLHHLYVVGPTGVGKSNLLASMAIQDATTGHGLALIDPKGDLVETVWSRLPPKVLERTIVLDPSQTDRPVGLNPLNVAANDEHGRELAADRVLHIFKDLYRANWGPRSDDLLRASLQTLVSMRAPNGSAFTICEVPELLMNSELRRYVMADAGLPEALKAYWSAFEALSEAERTQHTAPVLNKLRAVTMRTATRLMLGQSTGLDLGAVMGERQILLVSLAKGKLGQETATLAGALLVAMLWQTTLERVNVTPEQRRPFYLFLDEFQDAVRLSENLADLLAQARGLGVGAVLANQYLAQLPDGVRAAVLGTVRSQVAFQVEHDDARLLERRFAPSLSAQDLSGLGRYEIAARLCVNGETVRPVTGTTQLLPEPDGSGDEAAKYSRERWGKARAEVEAELAARGTVTSGPRPAGRVYRRRQP
jgi:Type IV secretion-system coupling protein DNA-binding domain